MMFQNGSFPSAWQQPCAISGFPNFPIIDTNGFSSGQLSPEQYFSPTLPMSFGSRSHFLPHLSPAVVDQSTALCRCCGQTSADVFCSKRCEWFVDGRCPNCGRTRESNLPYCSYVCCYQATQANWCWMCGVKQINNGTHFCSTQCAQIASTVTVPETFSAGVIQRPVSTSHRFGGKKSSANPVAELLRHDDKVGMALANQFASATSSTPFALVNVVKIHFDATRRKQYLKYRSAVEAVFAQDSMKTIKEKYGHGGEGNEQRRFLPIPTGCSMGLGASGAIQLCSDEKNCLCCKVCKRGFNMHDDDMLSYYTTSSLENALPWCLPGENGYRGVLVGRAVIGVPKFVSSVEEISIPSEEEALSSHCTIISNGDLRNDGTYFFRNDAIDPLFIVLFQSRV